MSSDSGSSVGDNVDVENVDDDGEVFVVEKVIAHKGPKGARTFYKLRWENYPPSSDTWEPIASLECHDRIAEYENSLEGKKTRTPRGRPSAVSNTPTPRRTGGKRTSTVASRGATPVNFTDSENDEDDAPVIPVKRSRPAPSRGNSQVQYRVTSEKPSKVLGFKVGDDGVLQALIAFGSTKAKYTKTEVELTPVSAVKEDKVAMEMMFDRLVEACQKSLNAMTSDQ